VWQRMSDTADFSLPAACYISVLEVLSKREDLQEMFPTLILLSENVRKTVQCKDKAC